MCWFTTWPGVLWLLYRLDIIFYKHELQAAYWMVFSCKCHRINGGRICPASVEVVRFYASRDTMILAITSPQYLPTDFSCASWDTVVSLPLNGSDCPLWQIESSTDIERPELQEYPDSETFCFPFLTSSISPEATSVYNCIDTSVLKRPWKKKGRWTIALAWARPKEEGVSKVPYHHALFLTIMTDSIHQNCHYFCHRVNSWR